MYRVAYTIKIILILHNSKGNSSSIKNKFQTEEILAIAVKPAFQKCYRLK
jgi:hypothetical protein